MKLSLDSITREAAAWKAAGVALPGFDIAAMRQATAAAPEWVHFGAGNIFRGFIGSLSQRLLDAGLAKTGIVACDTFDYASLSLLISSKPINWFFHSLAAPAPFFVSSAHSLE